MTFYERYIKRIFDVIISFCGLIVLSPLCLIVFLLIYIDDPGPVIFTQKRIGIHKSYFKLHKIRSMVLKTPELPTHQLKNPDHYLLKIGSFIRKYSIDEILQLYDILTGSMSLVGPRPALWNQKDLETERDKYGANDVRPGLTGWAQINGRDELEIPDKAKLDGEYVAALKKSSLSGFLMDLRCFSGTISSVLHHEGVVEGGTGKLTDDNSPIGFGEPVIVNKDMKKKVLITGAGSYIGEYFEKYAKEHYKGNFEIDTLDMIDGSWKTADFRKYDTVYHVAGIAHNEVGHADEETKKKYYEVNTRLAVETAEKAKGEGVHQFVFMSSMIVYGNSAPVGKKKMITAATKPRPANFYGDSKWQADIKVRKLADDRFNVSVIRPPMIYGGGSKGNYPVLSKLARKLSVFPDMNNQRSMLYIENLCEFLCQMMLAEGTNGGQDIVGAHVFFPQNSEYVRTANLVHEISRAHGKKLFLTKLLNPAVWIMSRIPGRLGELTDKAFGNYCYDQQLSSCGLNYQKTQFRESICKTEEGNQCLGN